MKYQVKIQYTNPSHEHVSLRRRVESVTRLVEAANEQEAINRAANQQRALGFIIKEAAVYAPVTGLHSLALNNNEPQKGKEKKKKLVGNDGEKTDIAASGGVKEGFDPEPKDIAAHLVGKHGKGKVTKDHVDAYEKDRDSNKGIDKEAVMKHVQKMSEDVESVDEAQKKLKPSYWKAEWRLGTQSEVDKNNKKIYDKLAKTDPVKAAAFHDNLMKIRKEEVEQIEEGVATAQKVMDRAKVVANTNPDPKKRFAASGLAQKAMLRTINPTGVNTGIVRGGGNKTYRMVTGKVPPYQLTKKTGVSEEVEQTDEAVRVVDVERGLPRKSNVRVRPGSFSASDFRDRLAQAAKERRKITGEPGVKGFNKPIGVSPTKYMDTSYVRAIKKEEVELDEASKEGKDVMRNMRAGLKSMDLRHGVDSDKRDAGYKMSPAVRKAQAASDALSKREKKPQAGTLAAKKARNAAEKMVNKAKGNANKIDVEPSIEPGKPNA